MKKIAYFLFVSGILLPRLFAFNINHFNVLHQPTTFIPIKKGDKWGFCDKNKRIIIEPKFDEVSFFDSIKYIANVKFNGQNYFMDTTGKIVDGPLTNCSTFSEGLAVASQNDKYGFINNKGEFIIKPTFDYCCPFSNGLAAVKILNKWGFINKNGDFVIKPKFQDFFSLNSNFTKVIINNKVGFIDKIGNYVLEPKFKSCDMIDSITFIVKLQNNNWGVIDKYGNYILKPKFKNCSSIHGEKFIVQLQNNKWGIINTNNEYIIKPNYDLLYKLDDNFLYFRINNTVGIFNKDYKVIYNYTLSRKELKAIKNYLEPAEDEKEIPYLYFRILGDDLHLYDAHNNTILIARGLLDSSLYIPFYKFVVLDSDGKELTSFYSENETRMIPVQKELLPERLKYAYYLLPENLNVKFDYISMFMDRNKNKYIKSKYVITGSINNKLLQVKMPTKGK